MKSKNELLDFLKKALEENTMTGLCGGIVSLRGNEKINSDEFHYLHNLLITNKPINFRTVQGYVYWWELHDRKSRFDFIESLRDK